MAVFGYVRVSTDMQAEDGQSLAVQQRQLEGWAMQHGRTFDAMHIEPGISGAVPFAERPEGSRLWARLTKGDVLVAPKLDRMFRSAGDCLAVVESLKTRGVSLFLLDLNGGADDVSGNGIARLFLTIVSAFAEFERDRIGERIRATKRARRRVANTWAESRHSASRSTMPASWWLILISRQPSAGCGRCGLAGHPCGPSLRRWPMKVSRSAMKG
jgi:putative DNA-invertase from lambdoid prophage Rac